MCLAVDLAKRVRFQINQMYKKGLYIAMNSAYLNHGGT